MLQGSDDHAEGIAAFGERRAAAFERPMSDDATGSERTAARRRARAAARRGARHGRAGADRAPPRDRPADRARADRALIDPGSWYELGLLAEPELPARRSRPRPTPSSPASARVDGRKVCVLAIDATVLAGTTAPGEHAQAEPHRGAGPGSAGCR